MVEVEIEKWDSSSDGNFGGYCPKQLIYQKAKEADFIKLGINCI